ncbi:unnamed protein product [Heterobilharzia americana]|nr:unnamed protein product [Heterobilharzia americana]
MVLIENLEEVPENEIEDHLYKSLIKGDSFQALKNWIFAQKSIILTQIKQKRADEHYLNNSCNCNYLKKAQTNWERKMLRSLNSMCQELGIQLARKRPTNQSESILQIGQNYQSISTNSQQLNLFLVQKIC